MQFNSYIFILLFLPMVILLYFIGNKINIIVGKLIIILSSIIFYSYSGFSTFMLLFLSILLNYLSSLFVFKYNRWRKILLFIPVAINVFLLFYFKYLNFAINNINMIFEKDIMLKNIVMPLGISFFTFQQIAYLVAVYNKELKDCSLLDYLCYILYFPKLIMGPLADPKVFIDQINNYHLKDININNIAYGIKIFGLGLFKKVMIADVFSKAVMWGFDNIDVSTPMDILLVSLFYTFQIYFDFSGYSDMAVGSSIMLNIELPINFNSPYKALSIRDFWKRWHISLTSFFTKYIYIPLGGSRKGALFTYINTMIVFGISGLWHGSNWTFILWGVIHGLFMIFDRLLEEMQIKIVKPVRWFITFNIVNLLWLLFRSETISQWLKLVNKILSIRNFNISNDLIDLFLLPESEFIKNILHINIDNSRDNLYCLFIYVIGSFLVCLLPNNNYKNLRNLKISNMILAAFLFIWGFISLSNESVFVYFNF